MGLIDYPGRVMAEKLSLTVRICSVSQKKSAATWWVRSGDDLPGPDDQPQPVLHRGFQIMEAIKVHQGGNKSTRRSERLTC